MKVSVAALLFLILAVALGSQSWVTDELRKTRLTDRHSHTQGLHRPSECCNSYTSRTIRCAFMEDYFETSTGCSQPGVMSLRSPGQLCSYRSSPKRRMKMFLIAVSFLLITSALGFKTGSSSRGPYQPTECCFSYVTKAIPRTRVSDYYLTNSQCTKPAVVFITKKGHSICANPRDDWVQAYIKDLEEN